MNINDFKIEVLDTKSGHQTLKLNNMLLHSPKDPLAEARKIVDKHYSVLSEKKNTLIFGCGLGYHVLEICQVLIEKWNNDYKVVVVEPVKQIADLMLQNEDFKGLNVEIICDEIPNIYNNNEFIEFLLTIPSIIYHPSSFNIHKKWFKSFLEYEASTHIHDFKNDLVYDELKNLFQDRDSEMKLSHLLTEIKNNKKAIDKNDFFLLAYNEI